MLTASMSPPSRPSSQSATRTNTTFAAIRARKPRVADSMLTERRARASVKSGVDQTTTATPMNSWTLVASTPGSVWP